MLSCRPSIGIDNDTIGRGAPLMWHQPTSGSPGSRAAVHQEDGRGESNLK